MISDIVRFFLDPFHLFFFLIVVGFVSILLRKDRCKQWFFSVAFVWLLLITTPFLPFLILNSLESKFDPILEPDPILMETDVHILVLAAGYSWNDRLPSNSQLDKKTLGRLVEGIRLYKKLPNSTLITSGPYNNPKVSQAEVAKQAAIDLGVPEQMILVQDRPETTAEEVHYYLSNYYQGQEVIVVTSALHIHRAVQLFKRAGIEVHPSPANFKYKDMEGLRITIMPSANHIEPLRKGLFEYAALLRDNLSSKFK